MNRQGRQTRPHQDATGQAGKSTFTGHQGLDHEEDLIFELGRDGQCGVDLPALEDTPDRLGGLLRDSEIGLP
ncbi:MAG: aminomethyl-transferring glycine dehydrogenase subunit GcvPB, partial [Alphaproteobacteria bacterium]|nr:aminomethyl-transferring glycine dehydrogenase subunit GcvPB [Alphaproteobacteria bacterium]